MSNQTDEKVQELSDQVETTLGDMRIALGRAYDLGYNRGLEVGTERTRNAILQAASLPITSSSHSESRLTATANRVRAAKVQRAPRGSVRTAIEKALANGGLSEMDLGAAAAAIDPGVSPRSMGGELRRMRNRLYRMEGGKWFLIAKPGEKEAARTLDLAAPSTLTTQEASDDTETAIAA